MELEDEKTLHEKEKEKEKEAFLRDISEILSILKSNAKALNDLPNINLTQTEQKLCAVELQKDLHLLQEQQKGINLLLGQALNTLISQSKAPVVLQIGLFAMILIMFCIHVLNWQVAGKYGGVKFGTTTIKHAQTVGRPADATDDQD